jgi:sRNA-binding protein
MSRSRTVLNTPENRALIAALAERFPKAFQPDGWRQHRPLAIGVDQGIIVATGIDPKALHWALIAYTNRVKYLAAQTSGAPRFNLAGEPEGEVTEEQAEVAQKKLKAIFARREREAQKAKTEKQAKRAAKPPAEPPKAKPLGLAGLKAAALARRTAA